MKTLLAPLAIAFTLVGSPVAAQERPWSPLGQICGFLSARTPERSPDSPNDYAYQTALFRGAGVDVTLDSPTDIRRKMQVWWSRWGLYARCNFLDFNVPNGSILKFGVSRRFDDFISDVADWGVNLNYVDRIDDRTVLDYIEVEMERLRGTSTERTLRRYYQTLRDAGALHRRELRDVVYVVICPDLSRC